MEYALNNDINLPHSFGLDFEGLNKCCEPRRVYVLDFNVPEKRLNVVLVGAFVVVERSLFQLHWGVVFKVPLRKFRETHIFVKLCIALAVALKIKGVFLRKFLGFP